MSDDVELHVQVADPSGSSPTDGPSGLVFHSAENIAAPASSAQPTSTIQPTRPASEAELPFIFQVPSEGFNTAAQIAKVVSSVAAPVPWLGPAVELVASIMTLCDNVGKNKNAAIELYRHCDNMVVVVKQEFNGSSSDMVKEMVQDLERLFQRIRDDFKKWTKWNPIKAMTKQDVIAEAIRSYHVDLDQFSKRYIIATQSMIINWFEVHDRGSKKDFEDLSRLMLKYNEENTGLLELISQKQDATSNDVQKLLYFLKILADQHPDDRWKIEENISTICLSSEVLPPGIKLAEARLQRPRDPVAGDKTYSIYQGFYDGRPCAIKMLTQAAYSPRAKRRFMRQLLHWKSLDESDEGAHILPLIGAVVRDDRKDPLFCFVSPWMKGDALQLGEDVDRIEFCLNVAKGLKVLHSHSPPLFHGALRASNILIDRFSNPVLSGFGLLRAIDSEPISVESYPTDVMEYRWFPPEMVAGIGYDGDEEPELTTKSDIFMYGMAVLEIMTGEKPFSHLRRDPQVLFHRKEGELPERPKEEKALRRGLDDRLWKLLLWCWLADPVERPTIGEVIKALETMHSP